MLLAAFITLAACIVAFLFFFRIEPRRGSSIRPKPAFTPIRDVATPPGPPTAAVPTATLPSPPRPKRIVVAMTGATGAVLGIRLLQVLQELGIETHLVISTWAAETIQYETAYTVKDVRGLATQTYSNRDVGAAISSGSFPIDGMVIVPCSMRTLSGVRTGFADDLVCRAADVALKEQRRLVLVVRETPLSVVHLENMLALARQRVVIFPPVPAFYTRPASVEDIVNQSVGRIVDALGFESGGFERWGGLKRERKVGGQEVL